MDRILDDNVAVLTGNWRKWNDSKFYNSTSISEARHGGYTCTWETTGLTPGEYNLATLWWPYSDRPDKAPFAVFDGDILLDTVLVNQLVAPAGLEADGWTWLPLGKFTITSSVLKVVLTSVKGKVTVADAVRIEHVGSVPDEPSSPGEPFDEDLVEIPASGTYEVVTLEDGRQAIVLNEFTGLQLRIN